jgi:hypothetical protein
MGHFGLQDERSRKRKIVGVPAFVSECLLQI